MTVPNDSQGFAHLMQAINETAHKAAKGAVELVRKDIQLELKDLEVRVEKSVSDTIDKKMKEHMGDLSPHEHYTQHRKIKDWFDGVSKVRMSVFTKLAGALALVIAGAAASQIIGGLL